jgi:hypothetical protein
MLMFVLQWVQWKYYSKTNGSPVTRGVTKNGGIRL